MAHGDAGRRRFAGWGLWNHATSVVVLVIAVVVLGFGSATATAALFSVNRLGAIQFGLLAAGALVHLEATRRIERMRKTAWSGTAPHVDLRSVWTFAALLLLPPVLATAMVLLAAIHIWLRVRPGGKFRPPHKVIYSAATVLIANQVATTILLLAPGPFPGIPSGVTGFALVIAAATVRWLINYMLIVGVIMLDNPDNKGASALGPLSMQALDAGAIAMAIPAAVLVDYKPVLLPFLVVGLVAFHRCVLLVQLQHAASTDDKTGLLNSVTWAQLARQELARAERTESTLGILIIDLDHFGDINETHGHPAADEVLRAVAKLLRSEVREYDHVGRFGGDEFVIALPGLAGADLYAVAERLRRRIQDLVIPLSHDHGRTPVTGITASIGGALYPQTTEPADQPHPGIDTAAVDELLRAADSAVYTAKRDGRNRVELTPKALRDHQLPVGGGVEDQLE